MDQADVVHVKCDLVYEYTLKLKYKNRPFMRVEWKSIAHMEYQGPLSFVFILRTTCSLAILSRAVYKNSNHTADYN